LSIVNIDLARLYVSRFNNFSEREKLIDIYMKIPYQRINDSPTMKHYTDWSIYENSNLGIDTTDDIYENYINKEIITNYKHIFIINNNIIGINYLDDTKNNLILPEEHKIVAISLALSKKIEIKENGNYVFYHINTKNNIFSPVNIEIKLSEGESNIFFISEVKGENSMNSDIISLDVNKNSHVNFNYISISNNNLLFSYIKGKILGSISTNLFSARGKMSHIEYSIELYEDSNANFTARALGVNDDKVTVLCKVNHKQKKSKSVGKMKGIAAENSQVIIRGVATITESAHDSSTEILGKSLLIGKNAKSAVVPMLEVKTGRVNLAKHSASASKVPEDYIFYLQNRGLSKKEAEGIIIRNFLIEENDIELVKDYIVKILQTVGI
jgi:Fe-S cluster assembly scaffold protein SufB